MTFNFFRFGRKRRRTHRKVGRKTPRRSVRRTGIKSKKPTKTILNLCKKYGIKVSVKSGSKRRYKKVSVLKKQLHRKIKMRSLLKNHPDRRKQKTRRSRFGGILDRTKKLIAEHPKTAAFAATTALYAARLANAQRQGRNIGNSNGARDLFNKDVGKIKLGAERFSEGVRRELTPNLGNMGSEFLLNLF
jgi:hypothetical protein